MKFEHIDQALKLDLFNHETADELSLPLNFYESRLSAGFPSLTDDHIELKLDLNKHLIAHPTATYYARVKGNGMHDAGILDGDILIIDRRVEPKENDAIVCTIKEEFTIKRVHIDQGGVYVKASNTTNNTLHSTEGNTLNIFGVVSFVIHKL